MIHPSLKRTKKPPQRRKVPRRGSPTAKEKQTERERVWKAANGLCQLQVQPYCPVVLSLDDAVFARMQLVHRHGKRRFGFVQASNLCGCAGCHAWIHVHGWPEKFRE